jgi:hypothetical protein
MNYNYDYLEIRITENVTCIITFKYTFKSILLNILIFHKEKYE